ncbi:MAG TPA: hypothetical protein VFN35_36690, partial [Ktedonobacteraceae bacterium]|nr:hypothetical protein [Ktedonobacteraceae bacterium]
DLSTMKHYSLQRQGQSIAVALQPQLYVAPEPTFIGTMRFEQAFTVIARLDFLLIQTQITIQVNVKQGILVEVSLAPIILLNRDFCSITGAKGQSNPQLSLATYQQPQLSDPQLRDPHLLISGNLRLLGVDLAGMYLLINEHGLRFQFVGQVNPVLHLDLNGTFDSLSSLKASATLLVGIKNTLTLSNLGVISVETTVNGTLSVSYQTSTATATFKGSFLFQGISCVLPMLTLQTDRRALQEIADTLWPQISDALTKVLKNADQWLTWVQSGVIQKAGRTAEEVGKVLMSVYQLSSNEIAAKTQKFLNYDMNGVAKALKGAGKTANEVVTTLRSLGYTAEKIPSVIASVFPKTHADITIDHIDTPAGPHADTSAKHIDVPRAHIDSFTHIDIPRVHTDGSKHIDVSHGDIPVVGTVTPHGDSNPHVDQTITPHGDSNPHTDQVVTPHGDSTTPHADSSVPPHGDTSTHIDTNS